MAIIIAAIITAFGAVAAAIVSRVDWNEIIKRKEDQGSVLFKLRELLFGIFFGLSLLMVSVIKLYLLLSGDSDPSAFEVSSYMFGIFTSVPIVTFCVGILWHGRP